MFMLLKIHNPDDWITNLDELVGDYEVVVATQKSRYTAMPDTIGGRGDDGGGHVSRYYFVRLDDSLVLFIRVELRDKWGLDEVSYEEAHEAVKASLRSMKIRPKM